MIVSIFVTLGFVGVGSIPLFMIITPLIALFSGGTFYIKIGTSERYACGILESILFMSFGCFMLAGIISLGIMVW